MFGTSNLMKKCFQSDVQLYDCVNIAQDEITSTIVLWNKFQILVYEHNNLQSVVKTFIPDFQIHTLILHNNYILCLDNNHYVHTTSLRFKSPATKRFKSFFQVREQDVTMFSQHRQDHVFCLKYQSEMYYLSLHRFTATFQLKKKVAIKHSGPWPLPKPNSNKCLLSSRNIRAIHFETIKKIHEIKTYEDCNIILISFDRLTIYSCLFSPKMIEDEVSIEKLYTCPSEICNAEIIDKDRLSILISLKMGCLMILNLENITEQPKIIYLNTAIYKYINLNENIIYTDGVDMWISLNIYSKNDINFRELIVKYVKDFIKCGEYIICTTYNKFLYIISLNDETSYIKPTSDPYVPAEKLLNNSEYLYGILEAVEKYNDIVKKVQEESNYITALALSNRQDLMDGLIQHRIVVYESYQEALQDNKDLIITDNIEEYFKTGALLFVVKISTVTIQHVFANMISNLLNDLKVHVTMVDINSKILKTTSVKLRGSLRKVNILIGLNNRNTKIFEVKALIKIIVKIPGAHDHKQVLWSALCRKEIPLYSEHLITTAVNTNNVFIKESVDNIEDLIYKIASEHHKDLFTFSDITKDEEALNWSMYLKLPVNYRELLKNQDYCRKNFSLSRTDYLIQEYTMKEFLDSKNDISFRIGNEKVKLVIINDDPSLPVLKVTSRNICIAFNIRNFFSKVIYNNFEGQAKREYVTHALYNVIEILKKELFACATGVCPLDKFYLLADQFQRSVIGAFPI
ncbi:uncharacterized protein LOC113511131 [Galleria mellonella]|uniref:Uncharacterized protein LOC113511131 n=1 Tax=Galleria mellonella TaxID=7137 RepID=A0A6J1WC18_GALME|nr:uncharacterized protein LOC113511131 [Galleria mellonella]